MSCNSIKSKEQNTDIISNKSNNNYLELNRDIIYSNNKIDYIYTKEKPYYSKNYNSKYSKFNDKYNNYRGNYNNTKYNENYNYNNYRNNYYSKYNNYYKQNYNSNCNNSNNWDDNYVYSKKNNDNNNNGYKNESYNYYSPYKNMYNIDNNVNNYKNSRLSRNRFNNYNYKEDHDYKYNNTYKDSHYTYDNNVLKDNIEYESNVDCCSYTKKSDNKMPNIIENKDTSLNNSCKDNTNIDFYNKNNINSLKEDKTYKTVSSSKNIDNSSWNSCNNSRHKSSEKADIDIVKGLCFNLNTFNEYIKSIVDCKVNNDKNLNNLLSKINSSYKNKFTYKIDIDNKEINSTIFKSLPYLRKVEECNTLMNRDIFDVLKPVLYSKIKLYSFQTGICKDNLNRLEKNNLNIMFLEKELEAINNKITLINN